MLESISWSQFISTITFLIGGYYLITILLLYRKEITSNFNQRKPIVTNNNKCENQTVSNESMELMGSVRYVSSPAENVPREDKIEAVSLHVAATQEPEEAIIASVINVTDETLHKSVSTLLQEINTLTEVIAVGSKEECAELFRTLLSNYAELSHSAYEPEITAFIYESCKQHGQFQIERSEVKSWWQDVDTTTRSNQ